MPARIAILFLFTALSFDIRAFAEDFDARLGAVSGKTTLLSEGGLGSADAREGTPLYPGDMIRTGENASAEITMDDGAVLKVGPDSSLKISSLGRSSAAFFLDMGSLVAKIQGLLKQKMERLEVRTPAAVAAVRGTEFCVEHDKQANETTAGVFDEGKLSVSALDPEGNAVAESLVEQGNEVSLRAGDREVKPVRMQRLLRRKEHIAAMRTRLGVLRKSWKKIPAAKRMKLRERIIKRKAMLPARTGKGRAAVMNRSGRPAGAGHATPPARVKRRGVR